MACRVSILWSEGSLVMQFGIVFTSLDFDQETSNFNDPLTHRHTTMAWTFQAEKNINQPTFPNYTSVSRNLSRNRGAGFDDEFFAYTVKVSKGTEDVLPHILPHHKLLEVRHANSFLYFL